MADRIFLHVGAMKSATTYIQELCQLNRQVLRDAGVFWPGVQRNFEAVYDLLGQHRYDPDHPFAGNALVEEMRGFDGDVVISSESLLHRPQSDVRTLLTAFPPADLHVVVTARDLARAVPSSWQTHVRGSRGTVSWSDYAESVCRGTGDPVGRKFWRKQDLPAALVRWQRHVPSDQVWLVTVPPAGSEADIIGARFLSLLGRDIGRLREPVYRNTSLGAHSAELVRRLNTETKHWSRADHRVAFKIVLSSRILEERAALEPKVRLTADQFHTIQTRAKSMVAELESLGINVVGDLTDLVPPDRTGPDAGEQVRSTAEDQLAAACYALVEIAQRRVDAQSRRRAVRR